MVKVRVYKFTLFDMGENSEHAWSERYATLGTIAILGGKPMLDSYAHVEEEELESGMTPRGFKPEEPKN